MSGYFRVAAVAWEKAHYSAAWTPENPAPEWWAVTEVAWQLDRAERDPKELMSERELATFLGWSRRKAVELLADSRGFHTRYGGSLSQKRARGSGGSEPKASQPTTVESKESATEGASSEPDLSQKRAKTEPPRARVIPSQPQPQPQPQEKGIPPTPKSDPQVRRETTPKGEPPPVVEQKAPQRPVEAPEEVETVKPSDVTIIDAPRAAGAVSGATRAHPVAVEPERDLTSLLSRLPNGGQLVRLLADNGITDIEKLREIGPDQLRYCPGIGGGRQKQILDALAAEGVVLVKRVEEKLAKKAGKQQKDEGFLDTLIGIRSAS